ncbi:MAG: ATP-dependent metalloprotease FtsH [Fibrobacteres bacterium]|nr:ATP-dependent metalloprotease FtsH [Fibrobacterota bacterium]
MALGKNFLLAALQDWLPVKDKSKPQEKKPDPAPPKPPQQTPPAGKARFPIWYLVFLGATLLIFNFLIPRNTSDLVAYSEFKQKVRKGEIKRVEIGPDLVLGFSKPSSDSGRTPSASRTPSTGTGQEKTGAGKTAVIPKEPPPVRAVPVPGDDLVKLLDSAGVEYYSRAQAGGGFQRFLFNWILPALFFMGIWMLIIPRMGGGGGAGLFALGKSRAHIVEEGEVDVTFEDVAGVDEAKEELTEIIDFLKSPAKYLSIGGRIPKGVLLVGPPGTGKTLLARATAGEAKVPFFRISGSDFVEMIVGVGAARVRDLFKQAREKAPCIVFIDELDAIGKSRTNLLGGHDEREQTLNQLLVEMDGFDPRVGVIILAATNRPETLDSALLRPGRFDRHVVVDKPDLPGRDAILRRHARNVKMDATVDLTVIARKTPGFVGADLANLINEAALLAVKSGRDRVLQEDLDEAIEKVMSGLKKKNRLMNAKEKERVAHHEIGHALVATFTPGSDPVEKVSIIPRGLGALGFTWQLPTEERFLLTEEELLTRIDVLLGGRAAEQIVYGDVSTGASNDLGRATEIARQMVMDHGMNEKFRNVVLRNPKTGPFGGPAQESLGPREYSEQTQQYLDECIAAIMRQRYDRALNLLRGKEALLGRVARSLIEKETLTEAEFRALVKEEQAAQPAGTVKG